MGRACFAGKASEGFSRARSAAAGAGWDEDASRAAVGSEGAREKIDLIPPPALRAMLTTGPIVRCANAPGERARPISRKTAVRGTEKTVQIISVRGVALFSSRATFRVFCQIAFDFDAPSPRGFRDFHPL